MIFIKSALNLHQNCNPYPLTEGPILAKWCHIFKFCKKGLKADEIYYTLRHKGIFFKFWAWTLPYRLNKEIHKTKPKNIYQHHYSKFNEQSFLDDISLQQWNASNLQSTNLRFNDFLWRLEGCVDRHAHIKKLSKKQLKSRTKPWVSNHILK